MRLEVSVENVPVMEVAQGPSHLRKPRIVRHGPKKKTLASTAVHFPQPSPSSKNSRQDRSRHGEPIFKSIGTVNVEQ